jgi:hypothetical protein
MEVNVSQDSLNLAITYSQKAIERSRALIREYVEDNHKFKNLEAFAKYLQHHCESMDFIAIGNYFFEMDNYDDGTNIDYANIELGVQLNIEWKISRYKDWTAIKEVRIDTLGCIRRGYPYVSANPNPDKSIPLYAVSAGLPEMTEHPDKSCWILLVGKYGVFSFDWKHLYYKLEYNYLKQVIQNLSIDYWSVIRVPLG